jgi:hypothetical protein
MPSSVCGSPATPPTARSSRARRAQEVLSAAERPARCAAAPAAALEPAARRLAGGGWRPHTAAMSIPVRSSHAQLWSRDPGAASAGPPAASAAQVGAPRTRCTLNPARRSPAPQGSAEPPGAHQQQRQPLPPPLPIRRSRCALPGHRRQRRRRCPRVRLRPVHHRRGQRRRQGQPLRVLLRRQGGAGPACL